MTTILNLPNELIENIFSFSSYDEVSRFRLVCKRFDIAAQHVLNHGFYKVEKYHSQCLRQVKAQLPRRESERRKHPLARHCDILTAVETRLSLLAMTFMKYVETNCCCFIPGKVLDEIFKVVRYVSKEQAPARAHEILQELRDISSMAMEYFDENIAPAFKKAKERGPKLAVTPYGEFSGSLHVSVGSSPSPAPIDTSLYLFRLVQRTRYLQKKNATLKKEFQAHILKLNEQKRITAELSRKVTAQAAKVDEQDVKLEELNRKCNDNERVLATMAEILQLRGVSPSDIGSKPEVSNHAKPSSSQERQKSQSPPSQKRKLSGVTHNMETRQKRAKMSKI